MVSSRNRKPPCGKKLVWQRLCTMRRLLCLYSNRPLRELSGLRRWLLGTHHGAVTHEHLEYYLDEFTFRFNRRRSRSRGKLFSRLAEQAVAVEPAPYESLVKYARFPS